MAKNIERAKYVKRARQERAWPQAQLAKIADVNLRTIQRLEKDGAASFGTLQGISQAFGIDVKELNPVSNTWINGKSQKKVHFLTRLTSG
ncbi:MAG: helix-turn-helix transcriptional regulator, partial [bacterium]